MCGREVTVRCRLVLAVGLMAVWVGCGQSTTVPETAPPASAGADRNRVTEWAAQSESKGPAPLLTVPPAPLDPPAPSEALPGKTSPTGPDSAARAAAALNRLTTKGVDSAVWEAAHQELVELGVQAAPVLQTALQSDDSLAREWSASILALDVDAATQARSELAACLTDDSGFVRANAAAALALVPGEGARVLPVLVELAQSPDAEVRRMAAVNLGNLGDEAAEHFDLLTPLLSATDPDVVRPVVELCGRLGPIARPALPRLQQIAFEPADGELRTVAQQAVQLIEAGPESKGTPATEAAATP